MPCGVMVAHRILVPFVRVRVFPRQQKSVLLNAFLLSLFKHRIYQSLKHNIPIDTTLILWIHIKFEQIFRHE